MILKWTLLLIWTQVYLLRAKFPTESEKDGKVNQFCKAKPCSMLVHGYSFVRIPHVVIINLHVLPRKV
jgi:hypothetical protein